MNIQDRLRQIESNMLAGVREIRSIIDRLECRDPPRDPAPGAPPPDVGADPMPPNFPDQPPMPPAPAPAPPPPSTPHPDVDGKPRFGLHYVDPLVWAVAEVEAPKAGLRPSTIVAIQVWESNWYTSKLFKAANNVGGVKYRPDLTRLGHVGQPYTASDGNVYASWPTWQAGIAGQVQFLRQSRYDGVRNTDDALGEVRAIHDAGYAEHSEDWLQGVSSLVRKFQEEGHQ